LLNIARISPYEQLRHRQFKIAFLLSLLLHAAVLFLFNVNLAPSPTRPPAIIVNFASTKSNTPPIKPIRQKSQKILTSPLAQKIEIPVQPEIATTQETPIKAEVPADSPQSTLPKTEKIENISSLTRIPGPLKKIDAAYPASERRAGIQSYVLAEVIINPQGIVQEVNILKSGGNAFDTAVINALKKTVFTPGYIGDNAVPVRISIPFRFSLN
jgi:protein TonB